MCRPLALALPVVAALAVTIPPAAAAASLATAPLTLEGIYAPDAAGRAACSLAWSPGGTHLAFVWDDGADANLWVVTPSEATAGSQAQPHRVLELDKLPGSGEPDVAADLCDAVHDLTWSGDERTMAFVWRDEIYLVDLGGGHSKVTRGGLGAKQLAFSPDHWKLGFVRGADLWVYDLGSRRESQLTTGGKPDALLHAQTDWVYWEEIWDREDVGYWWSPDGKRIAYYEFDEDGVESYPLTDERPVYPEIRWQKYPKAGTTNPAVRLGVLDLATMRTTWLATGDARGNYLARVAWTPDSSAVAVQRLARDQRHLDLLRCGAADGKCTTLVAETSATWINLGHDFRFLPDGRFLWGSEASGWRRLSLYGKDGGKPIRALTSEPGAITSLDGVDEQGETAIVTVFGGPPLGAARREVRRVRLADGRSDTLASEAGWNEAIAAPKGPYWVHRWSDAASPWQQTVRDAAGRVVYELPDLPPSGYEPESLPHWELFTIPGPEGSTLPARILKPAGFDPSRKYPVITYHYGGPGSQQVADEWGGRWALWFFLMAERGYVVFTVDNQASLFFGKQGEDRVHRAFGELELAGQKAGVAWLAKQPWVDATRIGLFGWSGGGTNTLYSILHAPGTWKATIAGAPVTDWHLYDSIWTERYMDRPEDNAAGYAASSPISAADKLADPLLLVYGTGDDNVHPQNTVDFIDRLVELGKPHEVAVYPREKHSFTHQADKHLAARMTEWFDRWLTPEGAGEK